MEGKRLIIRICKAHANDRREGYRVCFHIYHRNGAWTGYCGLDFQTTIEIANEILREPR